MHNRFSLILEILLLLPLALFAGIVLIMFSDLEYKYDSLVGWIHTDIVFYCWLVYILVDTTRMFIFPIKNDGRSYFLHIIGFMMCIIYFILSYGEKVLVFTITMGVTIPLMDVIILMKQRNIRNKFYYAMCVCYLLVYVVVRLGFGTYVASQLVIDGLERRVLWIKILEVAAPICVQFVNYVWFACTVIMSYNHYKSDYILIGINSPEINDEEWMQDYPAGGNVAVRKYQMTEMEFRLF
jgi:hypothetical protein